MMDQAIDIILSEREGVVVHTLFADSAIDEMLRGLLDEVKHNGSGAEANARVSDHRRSPAPAIPAAIRPAHHTRVTATSDRNRSVTPLYRKVIGHKKISGPGDADLSQPPGSESWVARRRHAPADHHIARV